LFTTFLASFIFWEVHKVASARTYQDFNKQNANFFNEVSHCIWCLHKHINTQLKAREKCGINTKLHFPNSDHLPKKRKKKEKRIGALVMFISFWHLYNKFWLQIHIEHPHAWAFPCAKTKKALACTHLSTNVTFL
jgi:hypothetical protein